MAKGRKSRRRNQRRAQEGPAIVKHSISEVDRDALRKALTEVAKEKAAEFPKLLDQAKALLRSRSPKDILATTAAYALQVAVGSDRVGEHGFAGREI